MMEINLPRRNSPVPGSTRLTTSFMFSSEKTSSIAQQFPEHLETL